MIWTGVPKAAINEHCNALLGKNNIRGPPKARHGADRYTITQSGGM